MDATLYLPVYLLTISILCYSESFLYMHSPGYVLQQKKHGIYLALIIAVVFTIWLGNRPEHELFIDSGEYAYNYTQLTMDDPFSGLSLKGEWMWTIVTGLCYIMNLSVNEFFVVIEGIYIFSALWAVKRFVPTSPTIGFLFVISSLMFYTFGVNGIRNGVSCHLMLLAFSFFFGNKIVKGLIIGILAVGFHRSAVLPLGAMILSRYFFKDYKYAVILWVLSIGISLVAGTQIMKLLGGLGFDSRMTKYITMRKRISEAGGSFRLDLILYSVLPILLGWYTLIKKKIVDDWYKALCISYCICNAFWIMIIRVSYTNRFAYLSWFMYPVLIAYPLINLPIWKNQDRKIGLALALYCTFTLVMWVFLWGGE